MEYKLNSMTQNIRNEKALLDQKSSNVRQTLKASKERMKSETDEKIEKVRATLLQLADKEDEGETFEEAAAVLHDKVTLFNAEKKILCDAIQIRKQLGLKPSQSLLEMFNNKENLNNSVQQLTKNVNELKNKLKKADDEINTLKKESEKNEKWVKWSQMMEYEITGSQVTDGSPDSSRNILGEAILLGKGNTSTLNKLSVLRDEKKLLVKGINLVQRSKKQTLLSTINALRFINRLQVKSGHAPLIIPGLPPIV